MSYEHLFSCVVCRRDVWDFTFRNGRDRHIAPICNGCERGRYGERAPKAGAFMDRRMAVRVSVLANTLLSEASWKQWRSAHARA